MTNTSEVSVGWKKYRCPVCSIVERVSEFMATPFHRHEVSRFNALIPLRPYIVKAETSKQDKPTTTNTERKTQRAS